MICNSTRKVQALTLLTGGLWALATTLYPAVAQADEIDSQTSQSDVIALIEPRTYWISKDKIVENTAAEADTPFTHTTTRNNADAPWNDYSRLQIDNALVSSYLAQAHAYRMEALFNDPYHTRSRYRYGGYGPKHNDRRRRGYRNRNRNRYRHHY